MILIRIYARIRKTGQQFVSFNMISRLVLLDIARTFIVYDCRVIVKNESFLDISHFLGSFDKLIK